MFILHYFQLPSLLLRSVNVKWDSKMKKNRENIHIFRSFFIITDKILNFLLVKRYIKFSKIVLKIKWKGRFNFVINCVKRNSHRFNQVDHFTVAHCSTRHYINFKNKIWKQKSEKISKLLQKLYKEIMIGRGRILGNLEFFNF